MPNIGAIEAMARLGFAARGLMYMALGYMALELGRATGTRGALEYLDSTGGGVLLAVMALGFLGYAMWRLTDSILDTGGRGSDAKGIAKRIGSGISGIIHLGLALVAARLTFGLSGGAGGGGGNGAEKGAATALSLPFGGVLLGIVAILLFGVGAYQVVKAVKLGFLKHLDETACRYGWVRWLGRIGFLARGTVFVVSAWFLWQAAEQARAAAAGGTEDVLDAMPGGLRLLVAGGLFLFGVFSLVEARYRRITDPDVVSRLRALAT